MAELKVTTRCVSG